MSTSRRYAVLIGNQTFAEDSGFAPLQCPVNDARGMHEVLLKSEFAWFTEAVLLEDKVNHLVRERLEAVFSAAQKGDQVLVYYSGHGERDDGGHLYLAARNTLRGRLLSTSLEIGLLARLIARSRCEKVALILDCCKSGAAENDFLFKGEDDGELQQLHAERGLHILAASSPFEPAVERAGETHSLFTKHLLTGIRENRAAHAGSERVTIASLHEHVRGQLAAEAAQRPVWNALRGGEFIVARARKVYTDEHWRAFKKKLVTEEDDLPEQVFDHALDVVRAKQPERDKQFLVLLEHWYEGRSNRGAFISGWLKLSGVAQTAKPVTPAPSPAPPAPVRPPPPKQPANFTDTLNGVPLEMIYVPGGKFMMGSPDGQGHDNERPQHLVTVPGFFIGKFQVTQTQWQAVMGQNPSNFNGERLPVECVSWEEAKQFCAKLKTLTGRDYRLPSEAEWEYACRAGTTGDFAGEPEQMGWYRENSRNTTHPVGEKQPNAFGLYDMHGNVWEWCEDVWHDNYNGAPDDGSAWVSGGNADRRILRGGSWVNHLSRARSVGRLIDNLPGGRSGTPGFRVVVGRPTSSS